MSKWEQDRRDSAADFKRVVESEAVRLVEALTRTTRGRILNCELERTEIEKSLDQFSGVDYLYVGNSDGDQDGILAVANRVQWTSKAWWTFTIREARASGSRTELAKYETAEKRGFLRPNLIVQSYVTEPRGEGVLLAVAVVAAKDLYGYVRDHWTSLPTRRAPDGNGFKVVSWDLLASDPSVRFAEHRRP